MALAVADEQLWSWALGTYGAGDIATTALGRHYGAVEKHPAGEHLLDTYGYTGMFAGKTAVFGLSMGLYAVAPEEYNSGVPLGLTLVGAGVSMWNLVMAAAAASR